MSRQTDLIRLAADALDDGRDPFDDAFLAEHGVTLDEVYALSEALAAGARLYVKHVRDLAAGGVQAQAAAFNIVDSL